LLIVGAVIASTLFVGLLFVILLFACKARLGLRAERRSENGSVHNIEVDENKAEEPAEHLSEDDEREDSYSLNCEEEEEEENGRISTHVISNEMIQELRERKPIEHYDSSSCLSQPLLLSRIDQTGMNNDRHPIENDDRSSSFVISLHSCYAEQGGTSRMNADEMSNSRLNLDLNQNRAVTVPKTVVNL